MKIKTKIKTHPIFKKATAKEISAHTKNEFDRMIQTCEDGDHTVNGRKLVLIESTWDGEFGFKDFVRQMGEAPSVHHSIQRKHEVFGFSLDNTFWNLEASILNEIIAAIREAMRATGGDIAEAADVLNENEVFAVDSAEWTPAKLSTFIYTTPKLNDSYREALKIFSRK